MKHKLCTENKDDGVEERNDSREAENSELSRKFICVLKAVSFTYAEGVMLSFPVRSHCTFLSRKVAG